MHSSKNRNEPASTHHGFTLIELMIAVAIVAILATIAIPSTLHQRQRSEIAEALRLAQSVRDNVTNYYNQNLSFPDDNSEAGVPEPEFLIGNKVAKIEVENGTIHITLGNKVNKSLQDKIVTLRPAVVTDSPSSPLSWLCGYEQPVPGMEAVGEDKTDVPISTVPASCNN
ncbi:hypothetical protein MNBD_GAMMA06-536 [hydrothermal vent metagenome]|uniref:Type IV pilus biogenesis protein PilE n=1 Tax=hydrothermal vent metagenome TaxID=652676 RepID=A0A3B0XDJ1_9ZZZZ